MEHGAPADGVQKVGLTHRSVTDEVYLVLRDRIVDGQHAQGSRLIERELAAMLGVSRVPVREALQRLKNVGLVEDLPRRGCRVVHLARKDVVDLLDVQESLETLAARLAAQHSNADTIKPLAATLLRAQEATERRDPVEIGRANSAFHEAMVALSQNRLLQDLQIPINNRRRWIFRLTGEVDTDLMYTEHEALYRAIRDNQPTTAEQIARGHVAQRKEPTLRRLTDTEESG